MNKISLTLILSTLFLLSNCKQSKDSNRIAKGNIDSAIHQLGVLEDSITHSWEVMTKNEEDIFSDISRLLQEIEYIPGHNKKTIDTLIKANENTKAMRYTQESMKQSDLIDQYDLAMEALVNNVLQYANSVNGIEKYQVAAQLMEEIPQQYQKIYLDRVHYDFHIQDYNKLLNQNKTRLEKRDPKFEQISPKPMFQLGS